MRRTITLLASLALAFSSQSQTISVESRKPTPNIGWDSLQNRVIFPELLHRAGLEGTAWTLLKFDSSGFVDSIQTRCTFDCYAGQVLPPEHFETAARLFSQSVREAFAGTKWRVPSSTPDWFSVRLEFLQFDENSGHRLTIEVEKVKTNRRIVNY